MFCHEDTAADEFGLLNGDLRQNQIRAQFFGGVMGPVMNNLSQINYTLTAVVGRPALRAAGLRTWRLTVFLNSSRKPGLSMRFPPRSATCSRPGGRGAGVRGDGRGSRSPRTDLGAVVLSP